MRQEMYGPKQLWKRKWIERRPTIHNSSRGKKGRLLKKNVRGMWKKRFKEKENVTTGTEIRKEPEKESVREIGVVNAKTCLARR